MELCQAVYPGKKNTTLFGCIKEVNHKGSHMNGKSQIWVSDGQGAVVEQDNIIKKAAQITPIRPKPPKIFADLLRQKFPEEMKEFDKAPWDFRIFSPCSMDDAPEISIYLLIGKKQKEKEIHIVLPLI